MTADPERELCRDRARNANAHYIARESTIEEGCTVGPGVVVSGHVHVLTGTSIGPGVVLEGPRSGTPIVIGPNATLGAGCVVSVATIGQSSVLLPGTVVTSNVPAATVVAGNPARIVRYRHASTSAGPSASAFDVPASAQSAGSRATSARMVDLTYAEDIRGCLTAGQFPAQLPIVVKRFFTVFDVPGPETRGEHAHRLCEPFLVAVAGSVQVICDNGHERDTYLLDRPDVGLHLPAMVWGIQHRYTQDAVLLELASRVYESGDYIRDYNDFLREVGVLTGEDAAASPVEA